MIVIPMAGDSRRFAAAGYDVPKYMLSLDGRPMFDWSVLSFQAHFGREPFLFVARDVKHTRTFLASRLSALGLTDAAVVVLDAATDGQAETVELGLKAMAIAETEPIVIFNIDTIRPGIGKMDMSGMDGWLEVFRAPGENWSFVEPEAPDSDYVARCAEKVRISDLCCTGLYGFARAELFHAALAAERVAPSSHELFVAPLYNHLIAAGHRIGWREVPSMQVIASGTPAEYEFRLKMGIAAEFNP